LLFLFIRKQRPIRRSSDRGASCFIPHGIVLRSRPRFLCVAVCSSLPPPL
jgi:hypothetical protein